MPQPNGEGFFLYRPPRERAETADAFERLRLRGDEQPTRPLERGKWR